MSCEVCEAKVRGWRLRDGSTLAVCTECFHIERDLGAAPANHRSAAYGGDPSLDRVRLALTARTLTAAVPLRPGARVFEIGFGAGALLARFGSRGHVVGGCDVNQLRIDVDPRVHRDGLCFATGIEEVPVPAQPFDLVYGIHVIEHVDSVRRTLAASRELLAPGGTLVLLTPAGDSASLAVWQDAWWLLEDPTHMRFFSMDSARQSLEQAGFTDVTVRRAMWDNVTMDGASLARFLRRGRRHRGVLDQRFVRWSAMALAPMALLVRWVFPRWRPTLVITARRPEEIA